MVSLIRQLLRRLRCLFWHAFEWRHPSDRLSELVCTRCGIVQPRGLEFVCTCLVHGRYPRHGADAYYPKGK